MTDRDPWTKMDLPDGVADCPCCGSRPDLYKYLEKPEGPRRLEVSCSNSEPLHKDLPIMATCPLIVPPDFLLCETIKGAVATWNAYAYALIKARHENQKAKMVER
jgi:hypothetical protein